MQCGLCGELWWTWEGHGPGGPPEHTCDDHSFVLGQPGAIDDHA